MSKTKARGKVYAPLKNDTNLFIGVAKHLMDMICQRSQAKEE
jgi:hypothetical protein